MEGSLLDDIYAALDATNAGRGREVEKMRATHNGPLIPHLDDDRDLEWRPPPRLTEVQKKLMGSTSPVGFRPPFARFTKSAGGEMMPAVYNQGQYLDILDRSRLLQPNRNYQYPKKAAPPRFRIIPEKFPEPADDLCHEDHVKWLAAHQRARDKQIHPVYYALEAVDKAKRIYDAHEQRRVLTRDLMTRGTKAPKLSDNAKATLKRVKQAVHVKRAFDKTDQLVAEEEKDKALLAKAKSDPSLLLRAPTPPGRMTHRKPWAVHDLNLRHLRTSTPWLHEDEVRELASQRTIS
mmetsp:Transcript_24894/g.46020  ORF Transcript_24894/g.46020 Transcript_24894/m.46020 type:complete len:292 (-) Transcript_24894:61-936(-)